jgi:hypothetical protein
MIINIKQNIMQIINSQNSKFSGNQHLHDTSRNKGMAIYSSQNNIEFMLYKSFGKPKLNVANSLSF